MRIEPARRSDLAGIRWLLEHDGLPSSDLDETAFERFLVCRDEKGVVAAVGLEIVGRVALLRSLVVDREMRGQGLGGKLTAAAEALASRSGVESIYLLTASAEEFFRTRGYRIIARSEATAEVQRTTQFSELCPSTAILMVKP